MTRLVRSGRAGLIHTTTQPVLTGLTAVGQLGHCSLHHTIGFASRDSEAVWATVNCCHFSKIMGVVTRQHGCMVTDSSNAMTTRQRQTSSDTSARLHGY